MSLVFDGEHAVGPSPLALLPQKILMWGPTVGVILYLCMCIFRQIGVLIQ